MKEPTERQARALELRRSGKKWVEIGQELGCSKGYAKLLAERALLKEHRLEKLETHTHELQEDKP